MFSTNDFADNFRRTNLHILNFPIVRSVIEEYEIALHEYTKRRSGGGSSGSGDVEMSNLLAQMSAKLDKMSTENATSVEQIKTSIAGQGRDISDLNSAISAQKSVLESHKRTIDAQNSTLENLFVAIQRQDEKLAALEKMREVVTTPAHSATKRSTPPAVKNMKSLPTPPASDDDEPEPATVAPARKTKPVVAAPAPVEVVQSKPVTSKPKPATDTKPVKVVPPPAVELVVDTDSDGSGESAPPTPPPQAKPAPVAVRKTKDPVVVAPPPPPPVEVELDDDSADDGSGDDDESGDEADDGEIFVMKGKSYWTDNMVDSLFYEVNADGEKLHPTKPSGQFKAGKAVLNK